MWIWQKKSFYVSTTLYHLHTHLNTEIMNSLFNAQLIGNKVQSMCTTGFIVRPLEATDYDKGFLNALSMLTSVGNLTRTEFLGNDTHNFTHWIDRFAYLKAHNYEYFTIVIEDTNAKLIVGAGTLVVERKFVHKNGLVIYKVNWLTLVGWAHRRLEPTPAKLTIQNNNTK